MSINEWSSIVLVYVQINCYDTGSISEYYGEHVFGTINLNMPNLLTVYV